MRARYQLNAFYTCVCLLAAIVIGLMFQSWIAFVLALAAIVTVKLQDGAIRLAQQPPRPQTKFHLRRRHVAKNRSPAEQINRR